MEERTARRARRGSAIYPLRTDEDVPVYGPEHAEDAPLDSQRADASAHLFEEPRLYHTTPAQQYINEEPNPLPSRRWPLYLAVAATAALVFVAINLEQGRQGDESGALPAVAGISEPLVPQEAMAPAQGLPTRIPPIRVEELAEAFVVIEVLPSPTPVLTVPPPNFTPAPTRIPLLRKGMQSDHVLFIQNRLVELNYLEADQTDGKYEDSTVQAIRQFQLNTRIVADGMAGNDTIEQLLHHNAIPNPTPTPRLNEPYVWATANGTYYHARADCRNMRGAVEMPISEAKAARKRPCDRCNPPR